MWLGISISVVVLGAIAWGATRKSRVGHCMRVGVMFLSGGFIFPNALIEDEAITRNYVDREAKGQSQ